MWFIANRSVRKREKTKQEKKLKDKSGGKRGKREGKAEIKVNSFLSNGRSLCFLFIKKR